MLLPVGAVSVVAVPVDKPVVATAETAGLQTAATPLAVLSSTINTSVEGKLNMLLATARERMFDSLLSAIDAASVALNISREPGEGTAAFAQRVAVAIRSLSPQQLVVAQQKLDAQMGTKVPLPLLAEALEAPESPQAVQLALNLEQASFAETDAVLKAVVNSYGQNAAEAKPPAVQTSTPAPAPLQKAADMAAQATSLAAPLKEPAVLPMAPQSAAQPAPELQETPQPSVAPQTAPAAAQSAPAQPLPQNGAIPAPQTAPAAPGVSAGASTILQPAIVVEDLATGPLLAAIATAAKLPTEVELIRSPLAPAPVPRDIQQLQADLKQGLQVVISPLVVATNSDLLQIINNPAASVEKTIAQALTANGAGQMSPQLQPAVDESGRSRTIPTAATPASLSNEPEVSVSIAALAGKTQPQASSSSAATAMYDAAERAGMQASLPVGVPFVVVNYLPTATPAKTGESKRVDRVDPVDDEEGERPDDGETAQHQDEEAPHKEQSLPQAAGEASDDPEAEPAASHQGDLATPELPALPQAALADRQHDHAFDFYRRMVAWE
jgi:hypothetical protein